MRVKTSTDKILHNYITSCLTNFNKCFKIFIKSKNLGQHGNKFGVKFSCFPHEATSGYRSLYGSVFSKFDARITIRITYEAQSLAEKGPGIGILKSAGGF